MQRACASFAVVVRACGVAVIVAAGAAGCDPDCESIEPRYAGEATDETWRALLDGRANATASDDVTITAPVKGGALAADEPSAITWTSQLQVAGGEPPRREPSVSPRRRPGFLDLLSATLFPSAHAHGALITSDLYFVEVDVPDRRCPVAGLTTDESFTFDDDDWAAITDGAGPRTLRIMSAFVTQNRITEGPFLTAPLTFTVAE